MPTFSLRASLALLLGTSLCAQAATVIRYAVTDLNTGAQSQALAINESGHIVGFYNFSGSNTHGFFYKDGIITDIPTFGGPNSRATALNDSDLVVGWADNSTAGFTKPFLFDPNAAMPAITNLGTIGGNAGYAQGINASGVIAGDSLIAGNSTTHAFIRLSGNIYDADVQGASNSISYGAAINAGDRIAGSSQLNVAGGFLKAVAFDRTISGGSQILLGTLGGNSSNAYAINDLSQIVGTADTAGGSPHAFLYDVNGSQTMQDLGALTPDLGSQANAINNAGQIVGWGRLADFNTKHALLFAPGKAPQDLNSLLVAGTTDWVLNEANGINEAGQIVGSGTRNGTPTAFLLTPVTVFIPDPAAPTLRAKKTFRTKKSTFTIRGKAKGSVTSVTYRVGKKASLRAVGTSTWQIKTKRLKTGATIVIVIAHGPGGNSPPFKIRIIRS